MKKVYLLSLLCCLCVTAFSQTTVTLYSQGTGLGSFTTGNSTAAARTDNTIVSNGTTQRGYAVFDLSGIPAGSTVNSVTIGTYVSGVAGAGAPGACTTYGYAGDLSGVTVPATLYADMVTATTVSNTSYGFAAGNLTLASTAGVPAFIQGNIGSKVSITFTGGNPKTYTMSGETGGASTSAANHAPYMTVTYCPPPTALSATATPNPVCDGSMLTLTGSATGATSYSWTGPGAYSSGGGTSTLTASPGSAGVYTLTAVNSCGTYSATATAVTSAVSVNPSPSITGNPAVCISYTTALTGSPLSGTWTSAAPGVASVGAVTGVVTGAGAGSTTITYTEGGCTATAPIAVNDSPSAITGPTQVCDGGSITLMDGVGSGTWTSSVSGTAGVGTGSGIVTGASAGTAVISYTTGGCNPVTYNVTVNASPSPIGGASTVCQGSATALTETSTGGTWSSTSTITAMVDPFGNVTGISSGTANILYTLPGGCQAVMPMTVNPLPAGIGGPTSVCENGGVITLTDGTAGGSFSGGSSFALVSPGGTVTGVTAGVAPVTYTLPTSCSVTASIAVNPVPSAVVASTLTLCQNATIMYSDPSIGGFWSSDATAIATVGSTTGNVTAVAAGTADISYVYPTGCFAEVTIVVNPVPVTSVSASGPTIFCTGGNVVLTDSAAAGYAYQWNIGGVPISGQTNNTYVVSVSGDVTVSVTNSFGCVTTSSVTAVSDSFLPAITYPSSLNFCIGDTLVLTADSDGAAGTFSYQWLQNGAAISGANAVSLPVATSGVYASVVSITGASGVCMDTTVAVSVTVNALPTPAITNSGALLETTGAYPTYQWYLNTVAIPGATSSSYVATTDGSYRVRVGDIIGCEGYSNAIALTDVGIRNVAIAPAEIYPNPATDAVYITSPLTLRAVITGADGKTVIDQANAKNINISSLANGIYIIMLYDESGTRVNVQKLVKE